MFKRNRSLGNYQAYYYYRLGNVDPVEWISYVLIKCLQNSKWQTFSDFNEFNDKFYEFFRERELKIIRDKNITKKQKRDSQKRLVMLKMYRKEINTKV